VKEVRSFESTPYLQGFCAPLSVVSEDIKQVITWRKCLHLEGLRPITLQTLCVDEPTLLVIKHGKTEIFSL
jgi:hypothetical protein